MEKHAVRVAINYVGVVRRTLIGSELNQNIIFDTLGMKSNTRLILKYLKCIYKYYMRTSLNFEWVL